MINLSLAFAYNAYSVNFRARGNGLTDCVIFAYGQLRDVNGKPARETFSCVSEPMREPAAAYQQALARLESRNGSTMGAIPAGDELDSLLS